jgi:hypothetical protein
MRMLWVFLGIFFCYSLLFAQDQNQNHRPTLGREPAPDQDQRPTLGRDDSPSLSGPRTSTTANARRLLGVKTIFVDRIDNSLGDKLADGLSRTGRFKIVAERKDADAVLSGTCFDSRRLKSVHSEVFLHDRRTGTSIWQDVVRRHYNPPALVKAIDDSAMMILAHLGQSVQEAERR